MKKPIIFILLIHLTGLTVIAVRIDRWARFRYLIGTWKIDNAEVTSTQQYFFIFNGTFLQMKTKAVFKPNEKKPKGETHEDLGIFSYDGFRNKLVLRSFHSEGFINSYVLHSFSDDGKTLIFITESVENAPAGTKAKIIFKKINNNEFVQKFYVSWPNKDYKCFSDNHFKKIK